jgi:ribonuclease P protein component
MGSKPSGNRSLGFGAERRLGKHTEFVRAQRIGRRVGTEHFMLLVAPQPDGRADRPSRLGIVATRKMGGAVQRNRVKRLCRECFRRWPDLIPPGVDLVVIARPGAEALGLADVQAEWRRVEAVLKRKAGDVLANRPARPHVGEGRTC